ncbi:hypothetical protein [Persicitalea jodogahamensis]|uniref:Uncharacterized protein n=1 Tax=Persicitalea jodogahamensis TaxID=402147 RepID=A0A8J3D9A7_9BACT|nr:hypothetical protein [Persicitalea jodogahamensis]GHB64036.1 hypothetical protein GCM10007390_17390 [Persicitalea jodogahamensis]
MSKTKIKAALGKLNSAAKGAMSVLNEVTDGAFEGSPAEAEPTRFANEISQRLQKQLDHLEANAKYEGMSEDEIADLQATEMAEALEKLQLSSAEKLRGLKPVVESFVRQAALFAQDDSEVDDFDEDPDGTEEPED